MSEIRKANTIPGLARAQAPAALQALPARRAEEVSAAADPAPAPRESRSREVDPRRRVAMNHRVREAVADRLAEAARALEGTGYQASKAELLEAFIYFELPESGLRLARLIERWRVELAKPPGPRPPP